MLQDIGDTLSGTPCRFFVRIYVRAQVILNLFI